MTGERLWSAPTQTGVIAPPVTFSVNGEQYIAVVVGWGGAAALIMGFELNPGSTMRNISRVLAYKLGANLELPPPPQRPAPIDPPKDLGSEAQILAGSSLYERNCSGCHGVTAVSGGVLPEPYACLSFAGLTSPSNKLHGLTVLLSAQSVPPVKCVGVAKF